MKDEYLNAAKLRAGDVLLSHGRRAHLRFIAWATDSSYSHAAIYSEPYQVFEAVRDGVGFSGLKPIKVERSPSGDRILCSTKGYTKLGVFRLPDPFRPAKYRDEAAVRLDLHRVLLPLNGLDYKQLEHFVDVHTRLSWIPKGLRKTLLVQSGSLETAERLIQSTYSRFFLLGTYPYAGRQRDDLHSGVRIFPVGEYVVLYRVEGNDVLILRVVRGSRDLDALRYDE